MLSFIKLNINILNAVATSGVVLNVTMLSANILHVVVLGDAILPIVMLRVRLDCMKSI
jgi:hypothetical protein